MKIGFDAKKAVSNLTGIGNYSRRCINGIGQLWPETDLVLFAPHKNNAKAVRELTAKVRYVHPQRKGALPLLWWRNKGMCDDIKREGVDIFHGLSNELPFGIDKAGCKTIVTIHDLIFRLLPHTFGLADRKILTAKTKYACRTADVIVAVSECTKRDIIRLYGTPEEKIRVVYQSISGLFRHDVTEETKKEVREKLSLPERYLLCVGTIEERKNQATVVKALQHLPEDYHLVLVGGGKGYASVVKETAQQLGVASRLHILRGLSNMELPAIYQMAETFVLLSRYEGFGIPIAEALASGIPVIAATGSCLEEAGGPDSIYVNPDDDKGVAENVLRIATDKSMRERMIERGKEYSLLFTDEHQAEELAKIYAWVSQNR